MGGACEQLSTSLASLLERLLGILGAGLLSDSGEIVPSTSSKYGPVAWQSSYTARAPVQADSATLFYRVLIKERLAMFNGA